MLVSIDQAAHLLCQGEVVIFPTETVYGLGANALSDAACKKIYELKKRPIDNPLIVHCKDIDAMHRYAYLPQEAEKILSVFSPGPLTIIVQRKKHPLQNRANKKIQALIADTPCAHQDTVALRMPAHPIARVLLEEISIPIAAPSANISGRISASTYEMATYNFSHTSIPILDGGDCEIGIESTILSFIGSAPEIVRTGYISAEEIIQKTGIPVAVQSAGKGTPGSGYSHYKPETPLHLYRNIEDLRGRLHEDAGIIAFESDAQILEQFLLPRTCRIVHVKDIHDYSKKLYRILYELRTTSYIFAPLVSEIDFGIHDRLLKAASVLL